MNDMPRPAELRPHDTPAQQPVDPGRDRGRRRTGRLIGLAGAAGLALLVGMGAWGHAARRAASMATLNAQCEAVPVVRTMMLKAVEKPREIELPGSTQAFDTATIYARATGYLAKRNIDIGSRVHAGEALAEIAAPDLDQQLAQARAQQAQVQVALAQQQANMELARVTNGRTTRLVSEGWSSQQQGDTDRLNYASSVAAVGVARANLLAQQAQVSRLEQLTGFERVVAPFDGVITSRQVDVGSLVAADANSGTPLFAIAHQDVLRVQIYVPQDDAFGLKDGQEAQVTVPELPGRVFHGRLARNASALATDTRTLLAEVDVDNKDGALSPGVYTIVHLQEPRPYPVIAMPSQALIFGQDGMQAAIYDKGVIRLRRLDIAADNGANVEVRAGLNPGDQLILDPPVGATTGMRAATTPDQTT
jgi:RND family efflux transporter MFP subunit